MFNLLKMINEIFFLIGIDGNELLLERLIK